MRREGKDSTWGKGRFTPRGKERLLFFNHFNCKRFVWDEIRVSEGGSSYHHGPVKQLSKMTSSLLYNEFIVYSTEQIRIKYLFVVEFEY